jgi:tight adherence protein B
VRIHRDVGGDLAEVLDRVSQTIRARNHLHRQVKALSAEGRISAVILFALPIVLAGAMRFINPGYIEELTSNTAGFVMLAVGIGLLAVGGLWLRRLVRPVY